LPDASGASTNPRFFLSFDTRNPPCQEILLFPPSFGAESAGVY
jgi:hypothetical protein